ncbi:biopolymer transport protein ExbB [Breznakibacter xylanolyticus]|uniref:Biopolymer transport protein ExbB n=2 Tax=Breznakibacter xylanolyticus TaxID=990 RepID=A0A2W7NB66_9BACT|nr:biopolymer transport protein ExbB [Breznakibacter xylanolyticus]
MVMKKLFALFAVIGMLYLGTAPVSAQEPEAAQTEAPAQVEEAAAPAVDAAAATDEAPVGLHKSLKIKFVEGGVGWMIPILLCLILGLAICIERVIYLNLSTSNTKKLLLNIENALNNGGVEAAKEVCRNTRGPVASIFYQGLDRYDEGVDVVEKSVVSYGSVQMGLLEKGLTWISLFIALAPMLGFLGTVIGMIQAFDSIQAMGDISPTAVAGGIKVALITTVFGLIVAIILQVFYNYILSKVDGIVNTMEDASISLLDIIVKFKMKN